MPVQDDARENELIELFGLARPANASRGGLDAELVLDGVRYEFELKSTTNGSVTTVRDFGPDHIAKWRGKQWLIGVYDTRQQLQYCLHGTPTLMDPWIDEKAEYIRLDFRLATILPQRVVLADLHELLGRKEIYSLEDAQFIQKRQYTMGDYRAKMDRHGGYSPERMVEILSERSKYLIERGSTLNNPHIPASYFDGWPHIDANHAEALRANLRALAANPEAPAARP